MSTLTRFNRYMKDKPETDPVERLRFFLSLALSNQDWIDVEQFIDGVTAERDELNDRPKGIAERFATLVEKKDGWYRGIIDYKIEDGDVARVGELKVTLVGEQMPNVLFKQETKGPPFPGPVIEGKWSLSWPSLKTRENRGCRKRLAPGQWWGFCGETDMGQTAPALCTECEGEFKLDRSRYCGGKREDGRVDDDRLAGLEGRRQEG